MDIRARHFAIAGTAALGLHVGVALWTLRTPIPAAVTPGAGGSVQIALAPAAAPTSAASASAAQSAVPPSPELATTPPVPPVETVTPPASDTPPQPVVEAVRPPLPDPVLTPVTPVTPPTPQVSEAVQTPESATARAPAPEAVRAEDIVTPPVPRPRPPQPKREIAEPAPERPALHQPEQVRTAEPVQAAVPTPPSATGSPAGGGRPSPEADAGSPAQVASAAGGAADYMAHLRAWLERHKEYPNQARRRRIEGTALLVFVMDRVGNVISHHIARSAGDPSLDAAVTSMIERAQPLPPMPDSFEQARLEIRVPVQFLLR